MKQKNIFIAAVGLLGLAFAFGVYFYNAQQNERAARATAQNRDALVRFHSPTLGDANAPVHIVEFLDPACEACKAFYPIVKKLMAAHPDKIRLSIRYAPFHTGSDDVVRLLEAARKQGKYWPTLEALFESQQQWAPGHAARLELVWPALNGLGLDMARLKEDMKSPAFTRLIDQDMADIKTLNISKTPTFFINGKPLPSFGPEQLQKAVSDALASSVSNN